MSSAQDGPSKVKVLLVDDERANLLALRATLEDLNLELIEADSGEQALRLLLDGEFAVVLLDIRMPGLDGFETARRIREREKTRHTPVIFQTAFDIDRATVEKAYQLGVVDFLAKPLVPGALRAKVNQFVDLLRLKQQADRQTQKTARLLASIVESSDDAIIGKDLNGVITSWNPAAERLFGYSAAEAVGCAVSMLSPPDRADEMPAILNRIRRGERVEHFDTVRRARDGRLIPLSLTVSPIRDEQGTIIGASKIGRDISERKRAEEALREERARLHATLNGIGDAVMVTDSDGRITMMNPVAQALTGWYEEAMNRPLQEVFRIINEESRQAAEDPVAKVLRHGQVVGLANHTVLIARDGTERPIDDSAAPVKNERGQTLGVVLVFRDISERRRAEEALRRTAEQLRIVTDSMAAPVTRCTRDFKYQWVSKPYAAWIGRPAAEIIGRPIVDIIGQAAFERLRPHFERALAGQVVCYEEQVTFQGLGPRWINAIYTPTLVREGMVDGWVAVVIDVDERKRMEEAIRAGKEQLAAELEAMTRLHALSARLLTYDDLRTALDDVLQNAIQTSRADFGNIQLYNQDKGALEIIVHRGFRQDFLDYFRTVRVDEGSACAQAMKSGERILIEDVQLDPSYERHRGIAAAAGYRAVQSTPLKSAAGKIVGMLSTHFRQPHRDSEHDERFLDLQARHAADFVERLRIEEVLKEADHRKDEFLATLAHELRNPLAPIGNAVELLRRADGDAAVMEKARTMMERQVTHLVRLVDDLLDISRITRGKLQLRKEPVELSAAVRSAVEAARPFIQAGGHELTISLPPEPVHLDADPVRLAQVISNLLTNSAKYSERGGHVWLTAERQGPEVVVAVRDTGIGIAPEHLTHVFEMFSQLTPALERSQGGLGIGLALVRGLVQLHGGTIEAHSAGPGKGSEFVVRLVTTDPPAPVPAEPVEGRKPRPGPRRRVLVVDDNRDAADSLVMMLRMMGHETETAYDGLEAVQAAVTFRPDVVLLDIGMPKMNGYEVAHYLRKQPWGKDIVLIAQTGWGQEEDKRRALEAGCDHHLTKPVEAAALEKLLAILAPVRY
jgi:PAS domain S-box-containing protein